MNALQISLRVGIYAIAVFVIAPLLALPVHAALTAAGVEPSPLHELTADCLKLVALIGLWPLMRMSGLRGRQAWGYRCTSGGLAQAIRALIFGVVSLGLTVAVLLAFDVRVIRPDLDTARLGSAMLKALIIAIPVALIEETWFRGVLYKVLEPVGALRAIVVVALIYAVLHFLRPDLEVVPPYSLMTGFEALSGMFGRMTNVVYIDGMVALFVAGLILGWLRFRTGCLAASIGAHAGWVFVIQTSQRTTTHDAQADFGWLASSYDHTIGISFIAITILVALMFPRNAGLFRT
jgi:uncharacterized protein